MKVGREVSLDEGTGDYTATINLEGDDAVCMGLSTDKSFARTIMAGMTRIMSGDSEILYGEDKEDFEDLLGGFLDIIGGHAVGALEGERLELEMGTPEFGNLSAAPFELNRSWRATLICAHLRRSALNERSESTKIAQPLTPNNATAPMAQNARLSP